MTSLNNFFNINSLETNNEKEYALNKLKSKNADMIVLNSLNDANAAFGYDTNKVTVFDKEGNEHSLELASKKEFYKMMEGVEIKNKKLLM